MTPSLPPEYHVKQVTKVNFLELFQVVLLYIPDFITFSKPQSFGNERKNKGSFSSSKRGIQHRL
jgi:hypothetical protein